MVMEYSVGVGIMNKHNCVMMSFLCLTLPLAMGKG